MANYLTEAQMNVYFGWTQGSDMPGVYVHLSGRDIDDAILKANCVVNKNAKASIISNASSITERPKVDLSSIMEDKINKLAEAKIVELLGKSHVMN